MNRKLTTTLGIFAALALFVSVNLFAGSALRFWRFDVTADELFTLSPGTRRILADLDEPITLRLFYSEEIGADAPQIDTYARRVRELLEEFKAVADGQIVLQVIEPESFSVEEELAASFGIRGAPANAVGDLFFFGIAATNSTDDLETIPNLDPRGETTLEYELAKVIHDLSGSGKKKVAILSSLPLQGGPAAFPGAPSQPGWQIVQALRESFEVEFLDAGLNSPIAEDTDVLVLVHPKELSDPAQFAIDQYALAGGKVLALVDAYSYFDQPPPQQQQQFGYMRTSQLDALLGAWGVELIPSQVAGDLDLARAIRGRTGQAQPFPLWMELNAQLDPELFNADDFVSADLSLMNMFCAGALRKKEGGTTEFTPLVLTSPAGRTIDSMSLQFAPDVLQLAPTLAAQFMSPLDDDAGERVVLAARISGAIESAFPDGAPEGWEGATEPLTEPADSFNAVVIADADFLKEELWTSPQRTQLGVLSRANNNPVLVINAIENLCGSNDLLSLRSRGVSSRPFERKEELTRKATERYQAKAQELEAKEQALQAEIRDLEKGADESGVVRITMQQFEEIQDKQQEYAETRSERGRVRHELKKEIESLGSLLKFLNIALVPFLVAIAGVFVNPYSRRWVKRRLGGSSENGR